LYPYWIENPYQINETFSEKENFSNIGKFRSFKTSTLNSLLNHTNFTVPNAQSINSTPPVSLDASLTRQNITLSYENYIWYNLTSSSVDSRIPPNCTIPNPPLYSGEIALSDQEKPVVNVTVEVPSDVAFVAFDGASQSEQFWVNIEVFYPNGTSATSKDTNIYEPLHFIELNPQPGNWTVKLSLIGTGNTTCWLQVTTSSHGIAIVDSRYPYVKLFKHLKAGEALYFKVFTNNASWIIYSVAKVSTIGNLKIYRYENISLPPTEYSDDLFKIVDSTTERIEYLIVQGLVIPDAFVNIRLPESSRMINISKSLNAFNETVILEYQGEFVTYNLNIQESILWLGINTGSQTRYDIYVSLMEFNSTTGDLTQIYSTTIRDWYDIFHYMLSNLVNPSNYLFLVRASQVGSGGVAANYTVQFKWSGTEDAVISSSSDFMLKYSLNGLALYLNITVQNKIWFAIDAASQSDNNLHIKLYDLKINLINSYDVDYQDDLAHIFISHPQNTSYLLVIYGESNFYYYSNQKYYYDYDGSSTLHIRFDGDVDLDFSNGKEYYVKSNYSGGVLYANIPITSKIKSKTYMVESPHPYPDEWTYKIQINEARIFQIVFEKIEVDNLYIYEDTNKNGTLDSEDKVIQEVTGTHDGFISVWIPSNTCFIKLQKYRYSKWGIKIGEVFYVSKNQSLDTLKFLSIDVQSGILNQYSEKMHYYIYAPNGTLITYEKLDSSATNNMLTYVEGKYTIVLFFERYSDALFISRDTPDTSVDSPIRIASTGDYRGETIYFTLNITSTDYICIGVGGPESTTHLHIYKPVDNLSYELYSTVTVDYGTVKYFFVRNVSTSKWLIGVHHLYKNSKLIITFIKEGDEDIQDALNNKNPFRMQSIGDYYGELLVIRIEVRSTSDYLLIVAGSEISATYLYLWGPSPSNNSLELKWDERVEEEEVYHRIYAGPINGYWIIVLQHCYPNSKIYLTELQEGEEDALITSQSTPILIETYSTYYGGCYVLNLTTESSSTWLGFDPSLQTYSEAIFYYFDNYFSKPTVHIRSDDTWKAYNTEQENWTKLDFNESIWWNADSRHNDMDDVPFGMEGTDAFWIWTVDYDYYETVGYFRKKFYVPSGDYSYARLRIALTSNCYDASIWINEKYVGKIQYEYETPSFTLNVTSFIKAGEQNIIAIKVSKAYRSSNAAILFDLDIYEDVKSQAWAWSHIQGKDYDHKLINKFSTLPFRKIFFIEWSQTNATLTIHQSKDAEIIGTPYDYTYTPHYCGQPTYLSLSTNNLEWFAISSILNKSYTHYSVYVENPQFGATYGYQSSIYEKDHLLLIVNHQNTVVRNINGSLITLAKGIPVDWYDAYYSYRAGYYLKDYLTSSLEDRISFYDYVPSVDVDPYEYGLVIDIYVEVLQSGTYKFRVTIDNYVNLQIDGQEALDSTVAGTHVIPSMFNWTSGEIHHIKIEHVNYGGVGKLILEFSPTGGANWFVFDSENQYLLPYYPINPSGRIFNLKVSGLYSDPNKVIANWRTPTLTNTWVLVLIGEQSVETVFRVKGSSNTQLNITEETTLYIKNIEEDGEILIYRISLPTREDTRIFFDAVAQDIEGILFGIISDCSFGFSYVYQDTRTFSYHKILAVKTYTLIISGYKTSNSIIKITQHYSKTVNLPYLENITLTKENISYHIAIEMPAMVKTANLTVKLLNNSKSEIYLYNVPEDYCLLFRDRLLGYDESQYTMEYPDPGLYLITIIGPPNITIEINVTIFLIPYFHLPIQVNIIYPHWNQIINGSILVKVNATCKYGDPISSMFLYIGLTSNYTGRSKWFHGQYNSKTNLLEASVDTTLVHDGPTVLIAYVTDTSSHVGINSIIVIIDNPPANQTRLFFVDKNPPDVILYSPSNGSIIGKETEVHLKIVDESGVKNANYSLNGITWFNLQYNSTTNTYWFTWDPDKNKTTTIFVKTCDIYNNLGTYTINVFYMTNETKPPTTLTIIVDRAPPQLISISYPSKVSKDETFEIKVVLKDISGISNVNISLILNDEPWKKAEMTLQNGVYITYLKLSTSGTLKFNIEACDIYGNKLITKYYTIEIAEVSKRPSKPETILLLTIITIPAASILIYLYKRKAKSIVQEQSSSKPKHKTTNQLPSLSTFILLKVFTGRQIT